MVKVRTATPADAEALLRIYVPHVRNSACTFETRVPETNTFAERIRKCLQKFPWLVCETEGEIAGYVYASTHREREAYQWTCESSVYVHEAYRGKGVGMTLYEALFAILKQQRLVNVYAGITLPNHASVKLHEACGFRKFAEYANIGYKLGNWQNVGWWELRLNKYDPKPSPPLWFADTGATAFEGLLAEAANRLAATIRS